MENNKKKPQKAEDFIGWVSPDGKLKVIGIIEKSKHTKYKVECSECSKDKELFPDGYFVGYKNNLLSGQKPCGCSKQTKWKSWQYLILARRVGEKKDFIVHGFMGEYKGNNSKLQIECVKDGYRWNACLTNLLSYKSGCKKCSNRYTPTKQEALEQCISICTEMKYEFVGFPNDYKNVYSRFEYICPTHGLQNVGYTKFVKSGNRCGDCARDLSCFNGYFSERAEEQDYLYILNFDNKFIKIGRAFDVTDRIKRLKNLSKIPIDKIYKLKIFTSSHQEVYDYEQEILKNLRILGFQYYVNWTNECFENECLSYLNKMLDLCEFEVII